MLSILITALIFFGVLSMLVFVHELGHYTVARLIGVHVEEFGFGLPPRAWGKLIGGTIYSLNWLPIGGFVRLAGEDDEEHAAQKHPTEKQKKYFWARSKKERAAILLAGVTINFVLAVGLVSVLLMTGYTVPAGKVTIGSIAPESPASNAGLVAGDTIASMSFADENGQTETKPVTTARDVQTITNSHVEKELTMQITREGTSLAVVVIPRENPPEGQGRIGLTLEDTKILTLPWWQAPIKATEINLVRIKDMLVGLGTLISRAVRLENVGDDVAGPIGIAQVTGQAAKYGWKAVVELASILSLNLALLNVLPFPALDGGRLLFVFFEKILGRETKPAFERSTHQIGMLILLGLIALISLNDILKLIRG